MATNFHFLASAWPEILEAAAKAEALAVADPRTSCFYSRRALEGVVDWLYQCDKRLRLPYQDHLSALIHEPTFRQAVGGAIFNKARVIKELGNQAVHSHKPVRPEDSGMAVRELFHVCFWLVRMYGKGAKPADGLAFDKTLIPSAAPVPPQTLAELQALDEKLADRDRSLTALLAEKEGLDGELQRLRAEVEEIRKASEAKPDTHDYSEAETRDYFIDLLLREAGWPLEQTRDREFRVTEMPDGKSGYVDYVLWGDDGLPLAIIEAKRTKRDARAGQQQAKLYADCLEKRFGRRPVIYFSNGYEHWMWDDVNYPPRQVAGFRTKDELELLIQRRKTRKPLAGAEIDLAIAGRYYQTRSIRRTGESFEVECLRKALLVMATGGGKTRTTIALCDLLMRCNWVKRALFLADRTALVKQAGREFTKHLPNCAVVNLCSDKTGEGRVFVATYPTMMGLIDERKDGRKLFGPGHFDLVVVDEAHRSIYRKYRTIFDYFDALLVGLTATPRDEIDRDTYGLFDLERGVPTDAYDLQDAVDDGFLVPSVPISVPLKFQRQGIKYDDLSDEEKEEWDAKEWNEDGTVPTTVEPAAVNKWLFNQDTVDKVLEHLMRRGQKVAGGDRLGKTIVFAKNQEHAEFIEGRFNANYPHYKGAFARIVTFRTEHAQTLIDEFSKKDSVPHIAISVDMLDTGIDVPEVVNLVFFKLVRSKTKFWQMVGRGTRLCPDLFGPGMDKECFYLFDYCQNLEFFSQNPATDEGAIGESLGTRIFTKRLELMAELAVETSATVMREGPDETGELRRELAGILRTEVAAMNPDNFVVRPKRKLIERYAAPEPWTDLTAEDFAELAREIAGLPTGLDPENEEAKRFDLLMLNLQLALHRQRAAAFARLAEQVSEIAALLEEKSAIPMVKPHLPLISHLQTEECWRHATTASLEKIRRNLRGLVHLIDRRQRKVVYTDFEDELGDEVAVELPGFAAGDSFEKFRAKTRRFLLDHEDELAIHKLRMNEPLTATDLAELERMLVESGRANPEHLDRAKAECHGLGHFVRSLVGLDREAAKRALSGFLAGKTLTADQIEFVNLIIEQLTEHGGMDPALLYESPFTSLHAQGPEGVFESADVDALISLLDEVRMRASA